MSTRKHFIAAAVSAGALLTTPAQGNAQTAPPKPAPTPAPRKTSEAARALAERMRAFDPKLTDEDIASIAEGVDQNLAIGRSINPKGTAIPNSVEPATAFRVFES